MNAGNLLDQRKLEDGLGVVGDGAVGVDGDRYRPHAQESESHQSESEHRRCNHQVAKSQLANHVADGHQDHNGQPQVIGGEIAGHEAGQNAQRSSAFLRGDDHFLHVARFGGGESLHQFGNHGARQRSAGDDRRQLPPLRGVAAKIGNHGPGNYVGHGDGDERRQPYQRGERRLEIHVIGVQVARLGDGAVDEIGGRAGHQHGDAHDENPYQQLHLHGGVFYAQQDKGDQRDAGDSISFEAVGAGADRIAGIVAGAIGNDAGIARVVFLDLEDDLHQVGADIGDLGEDAARDAQRRGAQRFADGKADEAGARVVAGNEEKNEQHHHKLDADEHHADAHAGIQRNFVDRIGLAAETGKGGARIGKRVYANAEPGHAIAAGNSQHAEEENDEDAKRVHVQQHAEIEHDDHGDEALQQQQELALGDQIGFAGFIDQLGNLAHGAVHGQILQPLIDGQAEDQAENTKQDAKEQQLMAVDAKKGHLREVRQLQTGFAARFGRLRPARSGD